jgi:hypothetical protein
MELELELTLAWPCHAPSKTGNIDSIEQERMDLRDDDRMQLDRMKDVPWPGGTLTR